MLNLECEATNRAVHLYFGWMRRRGIASPDQPSRTHSGREGDRVILRNVRGELARYRVRPDGRLRRVPTPRKATA